MTTLPMIQPGPKQVSDLVAARRAATAEQAGGAGSAEASAGFDVALDSAKAVQPEVDSASAARPAAKPAAREDQPPAGTTMRRKRLGHHAPEPAATDPADPSAAPGQTPDPAALAAAAATVTAVAGLRPTPTVAAPGTETAAGANGPAVPALSAAGIDGVPTLSATAGAAANAGVATAPAVPAVPAAPVAPAVPVTLAAPAVLAAPSLESSTETAAASGISTPTGGTNEASVEAPTAAPSADSAQGSPTPGSTKSVAPTQLSGTPAISSPSSNKNLANEGIPAAAPPITTPASGIPAPPPGAGGVPGVAVTSEIQAAAGTVRSRGTGRPTEGPVAGPSSSSSATPSTSDPTTAPEAPMTPAGAGPIDPAAVLPPGGAPLPATARTPTELAAAAAAVATVATTSGQRVGVDQPVDRPGSLTAVTGPKAADPADPAGSPAPDQLSAAGQLTSAPAPAAPSSPSPTIATPPSVSSQVAEQVSQFLVGARTLPDGTHHAVIKLSPEHLGDVTVTLDVRDGSVRMDLIAGPQALGALQNDLNGLRDQLSQSGLQLDDVSLRQSGPSAGDLGSSGNREQWRGSETGAPATNQSAGDRRTSGVEPVGYRNRASPASGQLDVLI